MRRTMFAPIRPSPMKPSCMGSGLLGGAAEGLGEGVFERPQRRIRVLAQVHAQDRQVVGFDRPEVAGGLGVDQLTEGVGPAGDLAVVRVIGGELEEPAARWAALVQ